jgi:hypothetical protein
MRRVRDPNAPPLKIADDIDSDIPDELLTESQKKLRRIQKMRKKRTIDMVVDGNRKRKQDGEEGA